ncbi:MAG: patatin-like phospholipase family protein [Bacteroidales bacterium]
MLHKNYRTSLVFVLLIFITASCTRKYMVITSPEKMPPPRQIEQPVRIALVLGGGAFRGIAHLGVLKVLEDEHIPFDLIIGTSAGSLVGAIYSNNPDADSLFPLVNLTTRKDVFDFSMFRSKLGYVYGKRLQEYITRNITVTNIEETKIPFIAMTSDIIHGKSIAIESGPIAPAVNASCAIPYIFVPVKMYGMTLVDGGVLDNVAADVARRKGAKMIIAVDVMADFDTTPNLANKTKVHERSSAMAMRNLNKERMKEADVLIVPDLQGIPMMSDKYNARMYEAGMKAARDMMPHIREILRIKGIN